MTQINFGDIINFYYFGQYCCESDVVGEGAWTCNNGHRVVDSKHGCAAMGRKSSLILFYFWHQQVRQERYMGGTHMAENLVFVQDLVPNFVAFCKQTIPPFWQDYLLQQFKDFFHKFHPKIIFCRNWTKQQHRQTTERRGSEHQEAKNCDCLSNTNRTRLGGPLEKLAIGNLLSSVANKDISPDVYVQEQINQRGLHMSQVKKDQVPFTGCTKPIRTPF